MKKFYLILAAVTGLTLASCTSDDLVVDQTVNAYPTEDQPIMFSSLNKGMTRSDFVGKEAADKLGNQFVVFGYKGATTGTPGSTVFDNYTVKYYENTAGTSASNSDNWEYVGETPIKHATDNGITSQTIKYWDYSQDQYDFIAWSTGAKTAIFEGTPAAGEVLVSKIQATAATSPATGLVDAYTFQGTAADLKDCYISELVTVKKDNYQQPVTLKFRALGTKVRVGIYETIPGYSVKNVQFYSGAATNDAGATPKLFTTTENQIYNTGKYTIYFPTVDSTDPDNNQPHIIFDGTGSTQKSTVELGNLSYTIAEDGEKTTGEVFLGRASNAASFSGQAEDNYYTQYLPNESGTNLNLRVNYTLESTDGSGEIINVKGATAQVPSIYTQWKAGFAYTYIFKISDKTNGFTGPYDPTNPDDLTVNSTPAGLYPITFDAVVVNEEDNDATQETITLVSAPSITTYQKGSTVVNNDEYLASTGAIFVTVNDGTTASTPDLANGTVQTLTGKAALYTIPAGKTEAEVIDALQLQEDDAATGTVKGRNGIVLTEATLTLTDKVEYGVDGNTISVGTDKVAKFTPAAGTYAFVYTKTASTGTTDKFSPVSKTVGSAVGENIYRYALKAATAGDVQKGVTYFENATATTNAITAFLGQGVGNLYTRSGAGTATDPYVYNIASGYAVTGTTYYYTTDNGLSYTAATNIAYADFATATLYTYNGTTFTAKTETTPVNGTAYYAAENLNSYCVIQPQQTTGLYVIDEANDKVLMGATDNAVKGMTYFDKYTVNDGVYYAKVIKVQ